MPSWKPGLPFLTYLKWGDLMSKATVHAASSAKRFGGEADEYLAIHDWFDSSKSVLPDNRHRMLYHHAFAIGPGGILEQLFGKTLKLRCGKEVSVRDIGEQHCREDFGGCIPTLQDWFQSMELLPWMSGHGRPPSAIHRPFTATRPLQVEEFAPISKSSD